MDFPIAELMDESACYEFLVRLLHPDGLASPHCGDRERLKVHRRDRAPILMYRCTACRRIFNAFTGTTLRGTKRRPVESGPDPPRHRPGRLHRPARPRAGVQPPRAAGVPPWPPGPGLRGTRPDSAWPTRGSRPTRCSRTRGKKGVPHRDEEDPPRRRANQGGGPRHLGSGPAAGLRGGRSPERPGAAAGRASYGSGDAGAGGPRVEPRGSDGRRRRVAG